jgi:hypothetical protein
LIKILTTLVRLLVRSMQMRAHTIVKISPIQPNNECWHNNGTESLSLHQMMHHNPSSCYHVCVFSYSNSTAGSCQAYFQYIIDYKRSSLEQQQWPA